MRARKRAGAGPAMAAMAFALAACHRNDPAGGNATGATSSVEPASNASPAATDQAQVTVAPVTPPRIEDAATFVPLQSGPVKDAIHRALRTGKAQRWQDGALSGYAVPSLTTDAHGCRAVRYTVDQLRVAAPSSINACEG